MVRTCLRQHALQHLRLPQHFCKLDYILQEVRQRLCLRSQTFASQLHPDAGMCKRQVGVLLRLYAHLKHQAHAPCSIAVLNSPNQEFTILYSTSASG